MFGSKSKRIDKTIHLESVPDLFRKAIFKLRSKAGYFSVLTSEKARSLQYIWMCLCCTLKIENFGNMKTKTFWLLYKCSKKLGLCMKNKMLFLKTF